MADLTAMLQAAAGAGGEYQISRSLRFNSADSAYLSRTPASAGNRRTFTISFWVKRSALGATQYITEGGSPDGATTRFMVRFLSTDTLAISNGSSNFFVSSAVYRDVSAWYHIVVAFDTPNATEANRYKIYVNGSQITGTDNYPSINADTGWNMAQAHSIGRSHIDAGSYFNGYITEFYAIDGQALTPSSFGEINPDTGVWQPIKYAGSYGTNGFYLNFSDNSDVTASTLGKDYSGNGNNWTPSGSPGFSVTAGAGNDSLVDTPTPYGTDTGAGGSVRGNYATFNSLNTQLGAGSLTNGNLTFTGPSGSAAYNFTGGTFEIDTSTSVGWYWEITQTTYGAFAGVSLLDTSFYAGALANDNSIGTGGTNQTAGITYRNSGNIYNYGVTTNGLTTWSSNGDVIGIAIKDNKIWFAKNGTWISGDPGAGTSPSITLASAKKVTPAATGINSNVFNLNAGQRPFAYTAPSGFKALCTTNLPTPTIGATSSTQAGKYFSPTIYTGNGSSSRSITNGIDMATNGGLVWTKQRSGAEWHFLIDSVRGNTKYLSSNATNAEGTISTLVTGFDSTGYSIGNDSGINSNGSTYVSWAWGAGGTGVSNTAGTITSTVSANTTAGISIVTYTGTGSAATVGHGLGAAPRMIIIKRRDSTGTWRVGSSSLTSWAYRLNLNETAEAAINADAFNSTAPTSSVFSVGIDTSTNASTGTFVAYCFAPVAGYSAFGSYTGNGSADGPFVYTGFRLRFLMIKRTDTTADWIIWDTTRNPYNEFTLFLYPNLADAEATGSAVADGLSNGFKLRGSSANRNASGGTYIYMAFAENPFKYSLAR